VTFWATGTMTGVETVIDSLASDISSGLDLVLPGGVQTADSYLRVDGQVYNDLGGSVSLTD